MNFDIIIYTDGSGTVANKSCGYSAVIWHQETGLIEYIIGCDSAGSNNFAEMMAILKALYFIKANYDYKKPCILIVSDSEWTIKVLKGEYHSDNSNAISLFKCVFDHANRYWGWKFDWKHVKRNTTIPNALCDKLSGKLRKNLDEFILTNLKGDCTIKVEDFEEIINGNQSSAGGN